MGMNPRSAMAVVRSAFVCLIVLGCVWAFQPLTDSLLEQLPDEALAQVIREAYPSSLLIDRELIPSDYWEATELTLRLSVVGTCAMLGWLSINLLFKRLAGISSASPAITVRRFALGSMVLVAAVLTAGALFVRGLELSQRT
jgi:hypothetical protein